MKYIKSKIFQRNINILVFECSNSNYSAVMSVHYILT